MSLYTKSPSYLAYKKLTKKPINLPPYARTEHNQVILCSGELWCRYVSQDGRGCSRVNRFTTFSNLKRHLREDHRLGVASGPSGQMSMQRQMAVILWYKQFLEVCCPQLGDTTAIYLHATSNKKQQPPHESEMVLDEEVYYSEFIYLHPSHCSLDQYTQDEGEPPIDPKS